MMDRIEDWLDRHRLVVLAVAIALVTVAVLAAGGTSPGG